MANNEELDNDKIINKAISESQNEILKEFKKGTIDLKKAIHELTNVTKNDILGTKQRANDIKLLNEAIKQNTSIQKQALNQTKQTVTINDQAKTQSNDLTRQYVLQRRFSALSSIAEGRFVSGTRDFLSTIPKVANLLNTKFAVGLQLAYIALTKFDQALARATQTSVSLTGGIYSDRLGTLGHGFQNIGFNNRLKQELFKIGMHRDFDNLTKSLISGYGIASYQNNQQDVLSTMGYAQKGLGSFGISSDASNKLIENLRILEGKNQQGIYAQLQRLTERFTKMSAFSPEQALQQATSLYDQTKHLGTNFEWASKTIQNFERQLKLGTLSLSDFAAMNRSFQSGGVQKNAGTAALLTEFASRSGINLPSSFLNSNIIGQGFALSSPRMLGNNNFAKAMGGKITEMLDQMGLFTTDERAGGLQHILSNMFGINISSQAALNSLTSNGSVDLIRSGVAGSSSLQKREKEKAEAEQYQKLVQDYYKGATDYQTKVKDYLAKIVSNTGSQFDDSVSHADDGWSVSRVVAAILSVGGTEYRNYVDRKMEITIKAVGQNQISTN